MSRNSGATGKRATVIVIGGDAAYRADVCFTSSHGELHIEPVADVSELTLRDFAVADVFLVWNDLALLERLKERIAGAPSLASLIVYQPKPSTGQVVAALLAGATDFIDWPCGLEQLENSVRAAIERRRAAKPRWERVLRARSLLGRLSGRERQVITAAAYGLSNKQIAQELSLSPRTIEIHRANALRKLEAEHTIEAVRLVLEAGFDGDAETPAPNVLTLVRSDDETGQSKRATLA